MLAGATKEPSFAVKLFVITRLRIEYQKVAFGVVPYDHPRAAPGFESISI